MIENPGQQPARSGHRDDSVAEQNQIAIAINSLKSSHEAINRRRDQHDATTLKWTRIYTGCTLFILFVGFYSALQAMLAASAANRAAEAADTKAKAAENSLRSPAGLTTRWRHIK
jgi:hypothetical protein